MTFDSEPPTKTSRAAQKKKRKPALMNLVLVSHSTNPVLTQAILSQIAAAVEVQLSEHYAAMWQSSGVSFLATTPDKVQPTDSPLVVFDNADQPGALGYHDVTPAGLPYGKVFLKPILDNGGTLLNGGNSLSCTVSHEALETRGDPYANFWADMGDSHGTEDALELCDRVEADSYSIDGISVSNFLGPRAFRNGTGPYDYMQLLQSPWELRSGGYAIRRTGGPNGKYNNVWGEHYPEWKKEMKRHALGRAHKRLEGRTLTGI